ncbi:MAG: tRNA (guanine-N1)-methyltransferase [Bacteroidota bacterium]
MRTIFFNILLTVILLPGQGHLFAQETPLDEGNITEQFDYAIEESNTYEEYHMVPTTQLQKLKSNVVDTLESFNAQIEERETRIASLKEEMEDLNQEKETMEEERDQALSSKNSITFLGNEIPKKQYNSIMWGLVAILAAAGLFMFFLFKRSQVVTREIRERHEELEKEFDAHKKRALEKEKTMARQHLNELNKLRGRE